MPPDPEITADGTPGETLARFAVLLAAHRGQLADHAAQLKHLADTVAALSEGSPKGPPMIAWHDLDPDEAAAVRADLARWVDQVLFPLYPSARDSVRDCWDKHPDAVTELSACWLEFRRIFAPATPARPGTPAVVPPVPRRHPGLPGPLAARHAAPRQGDHREVHRNRRAHPASRLNRRYSTRAPRHSREPFLLPGSAEG